MAARGGARGEYRRELTGRVHTWQKVLQPISDKAKTTSISSFRWKQTDSLAPELTGPRFPHLQPAENPSNQPLPRRQRIIRAEQVIREDFRPRRNEPAAPAADATPAPKVSAVKTRTSARTGGVLPDASAGATPGQAAPSTAPGIGASASATANVVPGPVPRGGPATVTPSAKSFLGISPAGGGVGRVGLVPGPASGPSITKPPTPGGLKPPAPSGPRPPFVPGGPTPLRLAFKPAPGGSAAAAGAPGSAKPTVPKFAFSAKPAAPGPAAPGAKLVPKFAFKAAAPSPAPTPAVKRKREGD